MDASEFRKRRRVIPVPPSISNSQGEARAEELR